MYKEIVTKAVIGKGKKLFKNTYTLLVDNNANTALGCWVINHKFKGYVQNNKVVIDGSFDINIWYSYDNNTKTNVLVKRFNYQETMNVKIKENGELTNTSEIIVRSLNQPSVTDVSVENNTIKLSVHKELGVEIVGDTKVRVSVEDDFEDYEEIEDEEEITNETNDIDNIKEDYLN